MGESVRPDGAAQPKYIHTYETIQKILAARRYESIRGEHSGQNMEVPVRKDLLRGSESNSETTQGCTRNVDEEVLRLPTALNQNIVPTHKCTVAEYTRQI